MHLHIGLMHGLIIFGTVLLFGTLWRLAALRFKDTTVGQAMAVMY